MQLTLIYAMAENRLIGKDGGLPWHLPDDFKHFKATTLGHPVLMGRTTFEQDAGLLPGRTNVVLSRNEEARTRAEAKGAVSAASLDEALSRWRNTNEEVFIIGGATLYQAAFPIATRIWRTLVHTSLEGDTYLPDLDLSDWKRISHQTHPQDERHAHAFTVECWERNSDI